MLRFCLILFFALIIFFALILVHLVQAGSTAINVSPSSITTNVGASFSINVTVSNVLDLYGWEFKLSWNATLLNATGVTEGPFLKRGGPTFFTFQVNESDGHMIADCTVLDTVPGVNGNGTLATITFFVEAPGECPFDLYEVLLLDSFENPIQSQVNDGYGHFNPSSTHDVAIINVVFSPISALPSEIIHINVTAQNQGSFYESFDVMTHVDSENVETQHISLNSGSSTIIPFDWNTTGRGKGEYTISASASIVPSETDTADNTKVADDVATILFQGHDVAVASVKPSKPAVGQNYSMSIIVRVKDYGVFSETFDTTVYANATTIGTQAITLPSGNGSELIFSWNTTGFTKGNYTISAVAEPVPNETNTSDNTLNGDVAHVGIPGDINADGKVNIKDIYRVAQAYGSFPRHPQWSPVCDINDDDKVDVKDYYITCRHYGETEP